MTSFKLYHETTTNNNIAALYSDLNYVFLNKTSYGNKIVKLFDITIVKFNISIKEDEANNQK